MVNVISTGKGIVFVFSNGVINDKGCVVSSNNGLIFSYNKVIGRPIKASAIELVDEFLDMVSHKSSFLCRVDLNKVIVNVVNVKMLFKKCVDDNLRRIDLKLGNSSKVIGKRDDIIVNSCLC